MKRVEVALVHGMAINATKLDTKARKVAAKRGN